MLETTASNSFLGANRNAVGVVVVGTEEEKVEIDFIEAFDEVEDALTVLFGMNGRGIK